LSGSKLNTASEKIGGYNHFDEVFNLYYPRLVLFASKFLGNKQDAEEVIQEMFVKFWQKGTLSTLTISIKGFVFKSALNTCIDFKRKLQADKRNSQSQVTDTDAVMPFYDTVLEKEVEQLINEAISELPEKRQEIFKLSRDEGLSYSQIAEKLAISKKTVETQMSRSLNQLRVRLSDYLPAVLF
jgi:RNA polymerase sigma-70 factor (ECF subfamily)